MMYPQLIFIEMPGEIQWRLVCVTDDVEAARRVVATLTPHIPGDWLVHVEPVGQN